MTQTQKNFTADIEQLMELVTRSLYSNREIFLRELISNASDAHDKLRLLAMKHPEDYPQDRDAGIWIDYDKDQKTLTIKDNGIGMSALEVEEHLGTIAKSGTKAFLNQMKTADDAQKSELIGQFGVGFYAAFVVADHVRVNTLSARHGATAVSWSSKGKGSYELADCDKQDYGTEVILTLKDSALDFLESWNLRTVIVRYSDHIGLPVYLKNDAKAEDAKDGDTSQEPAPYEKVNQAKAIWALNKVDDEQYEEYYKYLTHDFDAPLDWLHAHVEGRLAFNLLLYIPKRAPFDMFQRDSKKGIKLYVQRVFIMDDVETFLPQYLRFVKGVVDSADLPLNVSREILQHNEVVDKIRQSCIKRVLGLLETMAEKDVEKYEEFWKQFGSALKEGPAEDFANRERILKLCRFASTKAENDKLTSLDDYISRMSEGQDKIYYLTSENAASAFASPHLEVFKKKNIEVLVMTDRIDDWLMARVTEYSGKTFQSVAKADSIVDEEQQEATDEMTKVMGQMKEVLGDTVTDVKSTGRLTDSPACIVIGEQEMPAHLRKLFKDSGQPVPEFKPTLEVNLQHPLLHYLSQESSDESFAQLTRLIYDQAILADGGELTNPAEFVKTMNQVLARYMG